ncbi:SEC-C domain-containing protein [Paraburkholderia bengalensis]|uniref:SEC-C domain-containing protein n=1 Tax=Paraburkholderia bengalensis TaxID=2747562 RepID=A0ABU8J3J4_9BURK
MLSDGIRRGTVAKVGRNDTCPCGSGKKYKKCHGDIAHMERISALMKMIPTLNAQHAAKEHQRKEQQGLGKPIIAASMENGVRFVAVRNRVMYSEKWKTFHDFLGDYIRSTIGTDWGNAELKKPLDQRHPILLWYNMVCEQQRLTIKEPGKVSSAAMTGAVAAYMHLAYDLYALDHNAEVQTKLIERLRSRENFAGARYEVQVAAALVRAGFTLKFEDEDDRSTSHCEFTATSTRTGKQFSVEAKRAESGRITRQLVRALQKSANHPRIVFIDLNSPDSASDEIPPAFAKRAFSLLRRFETVDPFAKRLPPAYVFFTNFSCEYHLDATQWRRFILGDGFHIEDFKIDHEFLTLRDALNSRRDHVDMHDLLKSMRVHSDIPSTFDGESPEIAFENLEPRLLIGNRYMIPGDDGGEVEGVLASAVVLENEAVAMCAVNTADGKAVLVRVPLSDVEIAAWKRHPDTFFGEISGNRKTESVLDLYDFLMESYSKTPKEKLLEFFADSPEIEALSALTQAELASLYCERTASHLFAKNESRPGPLLQSKWRSTGVPTDKG